MSTSDSLPRKNVHLPNHTACVQRHQHDGVCKVKRQRCAQIHTTGCVQVINLSRSVSSFDPVQPCCLFFGPHHCRKNTNLWLSRWCQRFPSRAHALGRSPSSSQCLHMWARSSFQAWVWTALWIQPFLLQWPAGKMKIGRHCGIRLVEGGRRLCFECVTWHVTLKPALFEFVCTTKLI